jgi:hypothetical protein
MLILCLGEVSSSIGARRGEGIFVSGSITVRTE